MTLNEAILLAKEGRSAGWGTIVAATFNEKRFLSAKYLTKPLNMVLYKSYVKALSSIQLLNNPNIFSSWLGIIIASISTEDLLKEGSANFEERGVYENESWHEEVLTGLDSTPNEIKFTETEAKEVTGNLLKALATEEKMCVIYRYVEGFSVKEISRALRTTETAIISFLNSAIKKLETASSELQKKHKAAAAFSNPVQLLTFALEAEFEFLPKTDVPKNFLAKIIEDTAGVVAKSIYDAKENADISSVENGDEDDEEDSVKKGLNKKAIVIIAVIVAVAIGLTVFFVNKGNKPNEPTNEINSSSSTVPTSETDSTKESSSEESTEEESSSEESSAAVPVVNQTPGSTGSNSSQNRPQSNSSQNQNSSQSSNNNRPSSSQSSNSRPSNSGNSTGSSGNRPAAKPTTPAQTQPTEPSQTQPTSPSQTEPSVEEPDEPQVPDISEPEEGMPDIE